MRKIINKSIKEVKQYGFGDDFGPSEYHAFYDKNKIFKAIYNRVKNFDDFLKQGYVRKYKNAKDFAEDIFDFLISKYGEVSETEDIDLVLDNIFEDNEFFNEISKDILDSIVEYINDYMDKSLTYWEDEYQEYVLDDVNSNIEKYLNVDVYRIPLKIEKFFMQHDINADIEEVLTEVLIMYKRAINVYIEDTVMLDTPFYIGEAYIHNDIDEEIPEEIQSMVEVLTSDDKTYIESRCNYSINLDYATIYSNFSKTYYFVCDFDELKDYVLEYAEKNNLIDSFDEEE